MNMYKPRLSIGWRSFVSAKAGATKAASRRGRMLLNGLPTSSLFAPPPSWNGKWVNQCFMLIHMIVKLAGSLDLHIFWKALFTPPNLPLHAICTQYPPKRAQPSARPSPHTLVSVTSQAKDISQCASWHIENLTFLPKILVANFEMHPL